LSRCSLAVAAGVVTLLATCGSPTEVPGLFIRVGEEYELVAVFTTTYDCDPLDTLPRDSLVCGSETGVVTTQRDTLRAQLAIDDFCDTEGCLGSYAVGRFSGPGHATWSSHHLRPDVASTVHEYPDLTVQITPNVIDCTAQGRRRSGGEPICVGHEQETIVVVWIGLEPLGVYLGQGLPAGDQVAGNFSNLAGTMEPRSFTGTTWTLR
jgi:hypothetical protein